MKAEDFRVNIKISLSNAQGDLHASAIGKGVRELCRLVQEQGSLNSAAKEMGMAYSKAWALLKKTEEAMGMQLLERHGAHGSVLTADATRLLAAYDYVEAALDQAADEALARYFEEVKEG